MENKPRKTQVGEFEIRVLRDGRIVMVAPDEKLIDVAESIKKQMTDEQSPDQDQEIK